MRKKMTRVVLWMTALALVLSGVLSVFFARQQEISAARRSLTDMLAILDAQRQITDVDGLAKQFAIAAPDRRLTLIAPDGTVLADTIKAGLESHADRPEVQEALEFGEGEIIRQSKTTGEIYLYRTRRFSDGVIGRAAVPLSSFNALVLQSSGVQLITAVIMMLVVRILARKWVQETAAPIEAHQQKLEHVRSEFAANVSHELKTPLTSIKGFTDMLCSGMVTDPADQQRFLSLIRVEVDRLMELINGLLRLSALESTEMPQEKGKTDVLKVCQEVEESLRHLAAERSISVVVEGEPAWAAIPAARLREVCANLIENSLKYTNPGGKVTVSAEKQGERVVLNFSDNGIGIPKEVQSRVFERFYRVDKGRARKAGGTGLGLAIVKHIVQLYGGSIDLRSSVGIGTTFIVELPAAK